MVINKENLRISALNAEIYELSKKIRILTHLGWKNEIREEFFRTKAQKLPVAEYSEFDSNEIIQRAEVIQGNLLP